MMVPKMNRKRQFLEGFSPAQSLVLGYLLVLLVGTILLSLPAASVGSPLVLVDAVFMAASALCVTGLSVITIGTELTLFGQLVILCLIQIGAVGIMTMSSIFALLLGRKIGLRNRIFIQEDLNQNYLSGVVRLVRYVIALTLFFEAIGAVLLFLRLRLTMPMAQAAYYGVFHAISAFANAGFDLFGTSLEALVGDSFIILTVALLFIIGGLGFSVIYELLRIRENRRFSLHSRIVLVSTGILIAVGWVFILLSEFTNPATLGELPLGTKLTASFFTAVTPRTAGFNVIDTGSLHMGSLFFILILMFIGASPGSTGGGIKNTTFVALLLGVWRTITGRRDVEVAERRLTNGLIDKAWTIAFLALSWILVLTSALLIIEDFPFMNIVFEVVSAFGTVGLSMGITSELSAASRVLLTITMFIGRLGPMTLALAVGQRIMGNGHVRMPEEKISLG